MSYVLLFLAGYFVGISLALFAIHITGGKENAS